MLSDRFGRCLFVNINDRLARPIQHLHGALGLKIGWQFKLSSSEKAIQHMV